LLRLSTNCKLIQTYRVSVGEDEHTEKTSRFSSLNKRPRLDFTSTQPINTPTPLHYVSSLQSSINDPYSTRIPVASTSSACIQQTTSAPPPPLQTVLKPRKFFKSRGPIEVEVDPSKPLVNQETSPSSLNSNPILGSNQAININNSHSKPSYYQNNNSKGSNETSVKSSKNLSSPPANNSSKSFSTVCSPPIKLRIIKDKTTSKFVSVADATPSPVTGDEPQFPESQHLRHHGKKPKKKGRERKAVAKNIKLDTDEEDDERLPVLLKASKYSKKSRKVAKEKKPPKLSIPSPPRRKSGRVTRSSARPNEDSLEDDEDTSDPSMSILGQENLAAGAPDQMYNPPAVALRTSMESEATLRKLEEDAEFLKLSQMLSSMEEENSSSTPNSQLLESSSLAHSQVSNYYNSSDDQHLAASTNEQFSRQQSFENPMAPTYPTSLNSSSSGVYPHKMQISGSGIGRENESSFKNFVSPTVNEPKLPPEKKDMRSMLEDDWNDSYDDDSPKKSGSPPKVSRFDASAFSTNKNVQPQDRPSPLPDERDSDSSPILDIDYSSTVTNNRREYSNADTGIQRPIPVYGNQYMPNINQQQQQPPFNINTSPYAMRNLLSGPLEGRLNLLETGASTCDASVNVNEPQNLVCSKNPSDQVDVSNRIISGNYSDFGNQNSQSQASENTHSQGIIDLANSQGTIDLANSQDSSSSALTNSQSSIGPNQTKSTSLFKKASIFKSRAASKVESDTSGVTRQGESNKKRLAVYKHTFGQQDKLEGDPESSTTSVKTSTLYGDFDDDFEEDNITDDDPNLKLRRLKITNSQGGLGGYSSKFSSGSGEDDGVNKVTCKKEVKRLFTVVRNVKAGHELQESGEFHEFDGDVWYILEDLKDKNPVINRQVHKHKGKQSRKHLI